MGGTLSVSTTETSLDSMTSEFQHRKVLDLSNAVEATYFEKDSDKQVLNAITEFPRELQENITLYETVNVSFNSLTAVPETIPMGMPHLTKIILSHNKISKLPSSFILFFHLKELLLDHNNFRQFPEPLTRCASLLKLDLSHNQISSVSSKVTGMTSLCKLNLSNNLIERLPASLAECPLKVLLVTGNRLVRPSQQVCDEGSPKAIEALRQLLQETKSSGHAPVSSRLNFVRIRSDKVLVTTRLISTPQNQYTQLQLFPNLVKTPLIPPIGSTMLSPEDLKDRLVGLVYGAALGDSLAIATEHMTVDECLFHYDSPTLCHRDIIMDKHRSQWSRGDWTDSFDQLVLVLDSLLQWSGVPDELEFAKRLKDWVANGFMELPESHRSISASLRQVVNRKDFLTDPHKSRSSQSTSCADSASLTVALIVGVPFFYNLCEVTTNSARICKVTHSSETCVAVAQFLSSLVALTLQAKHDGDINSLLSSAFNSLNPLNKQIESQLHDVVFNKRICADLPSDHCLRSLSVLVQSLFWLKPFRETVTKVVMRGSRCRASACLVGAIHGAMCGYSGMPCSWTSGLLKHKVSWLDSKLNHLLDLLALP